MNGVQGGFQAEVNGSFGRQKFNGVLLGERWNRYHRQQREDGNKKRVRLSSAWSEFKNC